MEQPHSIPEREPEGTDGHCPHCRAVVAYEAWIFVVGELDLIGCPCCRRACHVSEVYPLLSDG